MIGAALLLFAAASSAEQIRGLIDQDRWKEAVDAATTLAREAPGPDAAGVLGEALYRAGRIDEAGEALAPVASGENAPARVLAQLGLIRAAQGKDEEAAALLGRAAATAPDDPWVLWRAAGGAATRAKATELLNAYIAHGTAENPDRLEGARGTLRLYAALGERKIWVPVTRPERLEIPLKPIPDGSGYFIEANAGGKKIRLLLDTGSTGLFVVERAVKKGGLVPLSEETVFAGGGSGRASSSRGLLAKLDFGGLVYADALVTTTKDEFDKTGRVHGVVGLSAFSGYRVTLDLPKGRMILEPSGDLPQGTPYWNVEGQLLVRARGGESADGLFLFDTGATQSMIDTKLAATIPGAAVDKPAEIRTYGGNVQGATMVRGASLAFQTLHRSGVFNAADLTMRSRLGGVEVSGYLGLDLLSGCTIVLDTGSHRVVVTPPPGRR